MPDNPFDFEDEDDQAGSENQNFKQLRDYAKKLEKQVNSLTREVEPLRSFKQETETEKRQVEVAKVFEGAGLSGKHAALYLRVNPEAEVTPDAVLDFAVEYELPRVEVAAVAEEAPAFDPAAERIVEIPRPEAIGSPPADGGAGPTATVITDVHEAEKLSVDNPAEYMRLKQLGRIKLNRLPGSGSVLTGT
jgi:hypothetical protein